MEFKFTFKHLEPLESITQYAQDRIEKIEKYNLHKTMKVHFIFSVQRENQTAEVIVDAGGKHYAATASDPTLYAAIDMVVDKLETQIKKHKDKVQHHHNYETSNEGYLRNEIETQAEERTAEDEGAQLKGQRK